MCGIIGLVSKESKEIIESSLKKGLFEIKHRGNDDEGTEVYESEDYFNIGLGHTRLSIIDLSTAGHQPMISQDGRYTIVFNGEIYNYKEIKEILVDQGVDFVTNTDTEVLLNMLINWGFSSLTKIKGMFAFAFFDKKLNVLTLARDAFGIKPLYYIVDKERVSFCSEIKGLLKMNSTERIANLEVSLDYLLNGKYDTSEKTFFKEIFQLSPSNYISFDLSSNNLKPVKVKWWDPNIDQNNLISYSEAVEKTRSIFQENIKINLRSDVPIGIALSGGVDSSAVACIVRKIQPEIKLNTFSYIAKGSYYNEEEWVDIINTQIKSIPHKILVDEDELMQDLLDLISAQGEPFGSTSIYAQYRVFKTVSENNIKVTLDGQGADELLAGYLGYPEYRICSLLESHQYRKLFRFVKNWSRFPNRSKSYAFRSIISFYIPFFLKRIRRKKREKYISKDIFIDHLPKSVKERSTHHVGRRVMERLKTELMGDGLAALLRHADRNSMRWTIESRVPFLTIDFAEFLLSLPEEFLISEDGITKNIFRDAMKGVVSDEILLRRDKIGFRTPESIWTNLFESEFGRKILEKAVEIPLFDKKNLEVYFNNIKNGKNKFEPKTWRIINYIIWCSVYNVSFENEGIKQ